MGLLEIETVKKSSVSISTDLKLPKELPSVEMALKTLADPYEDGQIVWLVEEPKCWRDAG